MKNSVACVAAHPDDEALGCAGTLALHVKAGDEVHIVFMTDGVGARGVSDKAAEQRRKAALEAGKIIGVKEIHFHEFPDNRMDTVPLLEVAQAIEKVFLKIKPQVIYTHHAHDLNVDHRIVHQAVMTACRPQPDAEIKAIYAFEVLSSTDWAGGAPFTPNVCRDISTTAEIKMNALRAYDMEMRPFPHARSYEAVEALARHRGTSVGLPLAEGFELIREIKL